jgi:hypothetical protein
LIAGVLVVAAVPAIAQQHHEHHHGSGAPSVANLELDAGRKWVTDASLRAGMADILAAFDADHPAIHAGQQTDANLRIPEVRSG